MHIVQENNFVLTKKLLYGNTGVYDNHFYLE
ncbi:hypothetical protein GGD38_004998 [Chitinophagaceae bacterium OAS944]|nr:hypothetical protein [Chitinophagaceae bacterium OAS944]